MDTINFADLSFKIRDIVLKFIYNETKRNKIFFSFIIGILYVFNLPITRSHLKKNEVESLNNQAVAHRENYRHDIHTERQAV